MSRRKGIMLAEPFDERKFSQLNETVFIQPKLNGERCRVQWFHDEPVLLSSEENEIPFLDHIKRKLKEIYLDHGPVQFDGELYVHGWSRQKIHSVASRRVNKHPDNDALEYHVFDIISDEYQIRRTQQLFTYYYYTNHLCSPIHFVDTKAVYSKDETNEWLHLTNQWIEEGYEGSVIRDPYATYRPKRVKTLLKFKPTERDTYTITGVSEAISQEGVPKKMIGAFYVVDREGRAFSVSAGKLNHEERKELWTYRYLLPNKLLEVKHAITRTDEGIPDCAVALKVQGIKLS